MRQRTDAQFTQLDFASMLESHHAALLAFLRGLVADPEYARDLVQDVFCDAWRAALRAAPPFLASCEDADRRRWLFHAAYCRAISARRRDRIMRWESLDAVPAVASGQIGVPGQIEAQVAEQDAVLRALASLSANDAACLLLNVLQGLTAAEIATILECTPDAAKKRLSRAKQRLRAAYRTQNADAEQRQELIPHVHE